MTAGAHHRTLVDQLRGWSAGQVATLLERRPDLVHPKAPADLAELAQRAQLRPSVDLAIQATTLPENRLLQVVVCCRPDVPVEELARALPEGVGLDNIEAVLAGLEAAALVWRHDGRLHSSGTLRQAMPTTLGPPLRQLVGDQNVDYVKSAIKAVRAALRQQGFDGAVPDRASGPNGRPPRKAELVEELESLLAAPGVVPGLLATALPESATVATAMAEGRPLIELDHYLYFSRYGPQSYQRELPVYWLFEHGLLLPYHQDLAAQPREVGMALRGGRPVGDLGLDQPALAVAAAAPEQVDADAAARAELTLDRLSDLLERWAEAPAKTLKGGGLGVTVMKQTAAALETDVEEATRLVELAHLAGLVETTTVTTREKRRAVFESFIRPTPAASAWLERPVAERWRQLATAWLRAEHWASASGRKPEGGGKAQPVLGPQYATSAPDLRRRVLDALAELGQGEATTVDALVAGVYWSAPQPWLGIGLGVESPAVALGWVHAEAELLGVVALGSLSNFGRALMGGKRRQAEQALEAARPEPVATFTLQGDLTATVVGRLERRMALELRLLADVESTGAATTLRFSEASLRRAIDAGWDGDAIMAFLEAHAAKGVPKALAYLVADVARRYGHLQVGTATSFVTSEDPAVLADACSHKRTRKLALRLLAPTVAVSAKPAAAVMDGLRDAGFLPTGEGGDQVSVAATAGTAAAAARAAAMAAVTAAVGPSGHRSGPGDGGSEDAPRAGGRLSEPFRPRPGRQKSAPALDATAAASLADAILAGPPPGTEEPPGTGSGARRTGSKGRPSTAPLPFPDDPLRDDPFADNPFAEDDPLADNPFADDDPFGDDSFRDGADGPEALDDLLAWAVEHARVLAISLEEGDQLGPPLIVAVSAWGPGGIHGIDLQSGDFTLVPLERVGAAMDLGPVDELANVTPLTPGRPRRPRPRPRRRR